MALTLRLQRTLLRLLTGTLLSAAAALGWLALRASATDDLPIEAPLETPTDEQEAAATARPSVDPRSDAWTLRLRRPLFDPPPPPPKKIVKKSPPPLRSKLLGTILEPGASRAMIGLPGGGVEFRGEGEPLGAHDEGAVIRSIGPRSVVVARGEETTELTIEGSF